jgi:hypothetical protein
MLGVCGEQRGIVKRLSSLPIWLLLPLGLLLVVLLAILVGHFIPAIGGST